MPTLTERVGHLLAAGEPAAAILEVAQVVEDLLDLEAPTRGEQAQVVPASQGGS